MAVIVASFAAAQLTRQCASFANGVQQTIVAQSRQYNALYPPFFMDIF
jgi:hypothetical protein